MTSMIYITARFGTRIKIPMNPPKKTVLTEAEYAEKMGNMAKSEGHRRGMPVSKMGGSVPRHYDYDDLELQVVALLAEKPMKTVDLEDALHMGRNAMNILMRRLSAAGRAVSVKHIWYHPGKIPTQNTVNRLVLPQVAKKRPLVAERSARASAAKKQGVLVG